MKTIIKRKTYNTETSEKLGHITFGEFGDPNGYEEILMRTRTGNLFLYGIGGSSSKYISETITPFTASDAAEWKSANNL